MPNLTRTPLGELVRVLDQGRLLRVEDAKGNSVAGTLEVFHPGFSQGAPIVGVGGTGFSLSNVAVVAGSPTISMETGPTGLPALRVITGVGVDAEIKFPALDNTISWGDAFLSLTGSYSAGNLDAVSVYVSQDAGGYAKGWVNQIQYGYAAPLNNPFEQGGPVTYWHRWAANNNFGTPTVPAFVADHKLRIKPRAGMQANVLIHGFGFAARRPKGRLCVVWDDGYDSMFKLGFHSLASRGIAQTLAIAGSLQGTGNGTSNLNQARAFVNAGGAVVAHGPWGNGGAGDLFSAYPGSANPVATAVADMQLARDYLYANDLLRPGADRCYVWPQGTFQQSVNSTALLDASIAAGFTFGRSASPNQSNFVNWDACSRYMRLCCPVIGHTWAGTTAAEATNITNITNAIAALGTQRADAFLMLHRVQPTATADGSMSSIGIRFGDLETIAAAIATQVSNGVLETVTMADMALASPTLWSSV